MQIVSLLGNSRVAVTEAADPTPGPGEVVVRTVVSAVRQRTKELPGRGKQELLALHRRGLAVEKLITHHYPLAEAEIAFQEFAAGRMGKVLLRYGMG